MVGPAGAVDPRGASELGHDQHDRLLPCFAEAGSQRHQPLVEAAQFEAEAVDLGAMGVPALGFQRRQARSIRRRQHTAGAIGQNREARAIGWRRAAGEDSVGKAALLQPLGKGGTRDGIATVHLE